MASVNRAFKFTLMDNQIIKDQLEESVWANRIQDVEVPYFPEKETFAVYYDSGKTEIWCLGIGTIATEDWHNRHEIESFEHLLKIASRRLHQRINEKKITQKHFEQYLDHLGLTPRKDFGYLFECDYYFSVVVTSVPGSNTFSEITPTVLSCSCKLKRRDIFNPAITNGFFHQFVDAYPGD